MKIDDDSSVGRLSKNSRATGGRTGGEFQSVEKEVLYNYSVDYLKQDSSIDCFIMGHRHIPLDLEIQREDPENSRYINVGDGGPLSLVGGN